MLFYVILSGIPLSMGSAAMVVPNYMLFSILGMNNQWYTLPLIYIAYNIPMSVWIMVGGMQGVSYAIEEAAQIDGPLNGTLFSVWYRESVCLRLPVRPC